MVNRPPQAQARAARTRARPSAGSSAARAASAAARHCSSAVSYTHLTLPTKPAGWWCRWGRAR
ncbi:hypothetical protein AERO_17515, partial [Aeromicrobium fastidiosum]|uniref:hypothetical protein n=1 Tax=Aeromicrobium fastidiosum TaxID=52699 RepID=UPI002023574D